MRDTLALARRSVEKVRWWSRRATVPKSIARGRTPRPVWVLTASRAAVLVPTWLEDWMRARSYGGLSCVSETVTFSGMVWCLDNHRVQMECLLRIRTYGDPCAQEKAQARPMGRHRALFPARQESLFLHVRLQLDGIKQRMLQSNGTENFWTTKLQCDERVHATRLVSSVARASRRGCVAHLLRKQHAHPR
jgi:hypothetical protein